VNVNDPKAVATAALGWAHWLITTVFSLGIGLIFLGIVLAKYGFPLRALPTMSPSDLAWLCGAWFLYRGGKLW
jgi:hypothetical protein